LFCYRFWRTRLHTGFRQTSVRNPVFDTFPNNLQDDEQFSSNVYEILELNFVTQLQEFQAW